MFSGGPALIAIVAMLLRSGARLIGRVSDETQMAYQQMYTDEWGGWEGLPNEEFRDSTDVILSTTLTKTRSQN